MTWRVTSIMVSTVLMVWGLLRSGTLLQYKLQNSTEWKSILGLLSKPILWERPMTENFQSNPWSFLRVVSIAGNSSPVRGLGDTEDQKPWWDVGWFGFNIDIRGGLYNKELSAHSLSNSDFREAASWYWGARQGRDYGLSYESFVQAGILTSWSQDLRWDLIWKECHCRCI